MRKAQPLSNALLALIDPYEQYGEYISNEDDAPYDRSYVAFIETILLQGLRIQNASDDYSEWLYDACLKFVKDIVMYSLRIPDVYYSELYEENEVSPAIISKAELLKSELADVIFESRIINKISGSITVDLSHGDKSIVFQNLGGIISAIHDGYDSSWLSRVINENLEAFVQSRSKFGLSLVQKYTPELFGQIQEDRLEMKQKEYVEMLRSRVKKAEEPSEGLPISSKAEAIGMAGQDVLRLKLLSDDLKKDRTFVRSLVAKRGEVISPLREEYGDDEELVLLALKSFKDALLYCSASLRNSASFAMKAIEIRGATYRMFPDSVRENEEVCHVALQKSKGNFEYLPVRIQELDSMRSLVGLEPMITDSSEAERLIKEDSNNFYSLSSELRRNPNLVALAAKDYPLILKSLEEDVWTVELCTTLFKWELQHFEFLPKSLKQNEHFLQQLIPEVPGVLTLLPWKLQKNQALQDLANWGSYPEKEVDNCAHLPNAMLISAHRNNLLFVEAVLSRNGMALEFCTPRAQNDEVLVRVAVDQNPEALKWASTRLQEKLS